jgi:hypothetical protein
MGYGSNDLLQKAVWSMHDTTCKDQSEDLGIMQMTTTYSKPKITKDLLIRATLHQDPGKKASKYCLG